MHFSDFEPNLAEKDVPDYKVVPKIVKMVLAWGSGLKIGRKVNIWTIFFAIVQTFARSWQGCHSEQWETQVCEEKSNFMQKKGAKSRRDTWVSPTDAVGTSECWLEVVVFSSKERPLLLGRCWHGSWSPALGRRTCSDLREWGGSRERANGETRRDSSRAKSGHTRSRPTETFRHLHGRQRGGITAKMFRTYIMTAELHLLRKGKFWPYEPWRYIWF